MMDKNKINISNRILLLVGSILTFSVGFTIVLAAICYFDTLIYSMGMQVAPLTEWIIDTIIAIIVHSIVGIVLISYSIYVFINFYIDIDNVERKLEDKEIEPCDICEEKILYYKAISFDLYKCKKCGREFLEEKEWKHKIDCN